MSFLSRDFVADLEVRSDGDGRTVHGIVVPFGQAARVNDGRGPYNERFQRGAFTKTLSERKAPIYLLSQHQSDKPLGKATEMREEAGGLYGAFRVSKTRAGDEHLELVRDGVLGSFSVGFTPIQARKEADATVRTEVALREVSLVTFPAYDGALVSGVRAALDPTNAALAQQLLTALAVADAQLDPIVDALCAADGALDAAQAVISQILAVPNPDCECCDAGCDCGDCGSCSETDSTVVAGSLEGDSAEADVAAMGPMNMNASTLTSLARRLDVAIAARNTTASAAGADEPGTSHSGRLIIARNNLRAELTRRGIR